ncbi:GNAT family N-acetyltransferase [Dyadobacter psychrotolerans]|uniref:GNAT family N-acetyltransferase n=1 Tax=Dyadobacter psychrotolerans TaxID=2541721 RepID=A0A4R5E108_9BACT|nr:GNAT family N-acetyltransferase [Dyadobacter psychrotolerans]TDE17555.1 GNAT family N-acetyltransferase [Dyadobacter psychrotolerans]
MNFKAFEISDLSNLSELQPADWGDLLPRFQYFIDSTYCHPIKLVENGQMIAVGTSMLHNDTAWLACIVVHPDFRNRGLGNKLTQQLIDGIDHQQHPTIYLDATDFGYPVYKKLGFEIVSEYIHLKKQQPIEPYTLSKNISPFRSEFTDSLLRLDKEISGECRQGILTDFLGSAQVYVTGEDVQGFYIADWGDGPIIAKNNEAGLELLKLRSQERMGAVIPDSNETALNFLKTHGFETYKTSRRMLLGKHKNWQPTGSFNWISGQLG